VDFHHAWFQVNDYIDWHLYKKGRLRSLLALWFWEVADRSLYWKVTDH
jgi:hypothetical protein